MPTVLITACAGFGNFTKKPTPMGKNNPFDLVGQLSFYAQYHNNKVNQLIHIVFVPTILWTVMIWGYYTGPLTSVTKDLPIPDAWRPLIVPNLALFVTLTYSLYYIILEPFAGIFSCDGGKRLTMLQLTFSCILAGLYVAAGHFFATVPDAWKIALAIHVFSWAMQFIGHGKFEGRKPALLDNLMQAFLLAPLFVWIEVLFMLGYRPLLQKHLEKQTNQRIKNWKQGSANGSPKRPTRGSPKGATRKSK